MEVRVREHRFKVPLFWSAAVFSIAIGASVVTSTIVASKAYRSRIAQIDRSTQTITVKGVARRRIKSDLANWSINVEGGAATLEGSYEVLDEGETALRAFLTARGFADVEVNGSPITTSVHFARDARGNTTREVTGYTLRRTIKVRTEDVQRVAEAASGVTDLLKSGVRVVSYAPQFTSSRVDEIKHEILGEASADARARAEEMATESGGMVLGVRRANQGVIQITPPDSTEVTSYGRYDTSTIEKDISLVVTITFALGDA